ncbi:nadp-dependent leukotriene b4 12-hydroxydehydrogenase [Diaporthe amygdali]|uniref:nadp-dependent leukotriene b4 12-hydroxydehydrogenase n=1 Tax=Phomopsis amygdali TaxID=1214568 RepID=UPI0022FDB4BC|nr:nadp-dependent leukotriene b4 12-hydroxydehydrogenase [Diaporthe amygdali]KAJ0122347.1 nadp-dependent leukotriene b4 12-hydroxydehydrogenase [Diaporthe amygdali]
MARESVSVVFAKRPTGDIVPGETFRVESGPAPTEADLKDGEVLFETYYISLDPSMRVWLRETASYLPPVQIGEVMRGISAGRILASKNPAFKAGDWATGFSGWREVAVLGPQTVFPAPLLPGIEKPDLLGALGMTGLTALLGLNKIGLPKEGELVVVSGAAGATGSIVGQICKLKGCRVVGIAGTDDKCAWLKELGFDVALNYKAPEFREQFLEATKDKIDVYWDNVGGEILDLALGQAKLRGRIVKCGSIGEYNGDKSSGDLMKNLGRMSSMRLRMEGFIVLDFAADFPEAMKQMAVWVSQGQIKSKNTVVKGGLQKADQALADMFKGINTGKLVVEVKDPEQSS